MKQNLPTTLWLSHCCSVAGWRPLSSSSSVVATTVCGGGGADSTLICHCVRVQQQQVSPFVAFSHFAPHSGRSSVRPFACATTDPLLSDQLTFSDSSRAHGSGAAALLATQKKGHFFHYTRNTGSPRDLSQRSYCGQHFRRGTKKTRQRDRRAHENGEQIFHDCQE